jgi:hypothetical protein
VRQEIKPSYAVAVGEYGLGHHSTHPARTGEPDDVRHEVENQDGQIARGAIKLAKSKNAKELRIRHAQVDQVRFTRGPAARAKPNLTNSSS